MTTLSVVTTDVGETGQSGLGGAIRPKPEIGHAQLESLIVTKPIHVLEA